MVVATVSIYIALEATLAQLSPHTHAPYNTPCMLQPATLTRTDMVILRRLAESLFNVALSKARRRSTVWPPPSYLQNGKHIKHHHNSN